VKYGAVSETSYDSLKLLEPFMTLVTPEEVRSLTRRYGFRETRSAIERLESGKEFFNARYRLGP
jgi:hypothetical protein